MKSLLLCTFAHVADLKLIVDYIEKNYELEKNAIYVFENSNNSEELYCTYNVVATTVTSENTILIHRKKETNTLYTINALNEIIQTINNGILDKHYVLDWERYRNSLLMTIKGEVITIPLLLRTVIKK